MLCHWTLLFSLWLIVLFGDSWCWSWVLQQWVYTAWVWFGLFFFLYISPQQYMPTATAKVCHLPDTRYIFDWIITIIFHSELQSEGFDSLPASFHSPFFVLVCPRFNFLWLHPDFCFPSHSLNVWFLTGPVIVNCLYSLLLYEQLEEVERWSYSFFLVICTWFDYQIVRLHPTVFAT